MRALVICFSWPPDPGFRSQGVDNRLGLFLGAIADFCSEIDMVHLVPERVIADIGDTRRIAGEHSEYWNRDVSVTLIPRRPSPARKTAWTEYGAGVLRSFAQPSLYPFSAPELAQAVAARLDPEPDLIHVQQLYAMLPLLRLRRPLRNVLFDIDDVAHRVLVRKLLEPPLRAGKLASLAQLPALLNLERRASALATLSFVCSELDRRHLRRLGIARNLAVVPNAVPIPLEPPGLTADPTLLFLGAGDYAPNAEAAERLATRIFPLIRRRVSNARLMIAGKHSRDLPSARTTPPGIEYLGFVNDIDALYAKSRVISCPITTGGGTRVKLIEAAAYARPMVSTHFGAEGLAFVDGEEILLHDSDADLADACVRLLRDDAECVRLGKAAWERTRQLYDAAAIRAGIARLIRELLPAGTAAGPSGRVASVTYTN